MQSQQKEIAAAADADGRVCNKPAGVEPSPACKRPASADAKPIKKRKVLSCVAELGKPPTAAPATGVPKTYAGFF